MVVKGSDRRIWSRNRKEEIEGVYSHQTALSLHELSDLNPAKLHMTVPTHFRRNSEMPGIVVPHYADLPAADVQVGPGYKYAKHLRPIPDLIEAGTVERTFIRQALRQAVDRGLITRQQLRNAKMGEAARKIVEDAHRRAAKVTPPKTYATAAAFRSALEERLKSVSHTEQVDLNRLRRQVSFDRLLARLFRDETAPWVLKGGYSSYSFAAMIAARIGDGCDCSFRRMVAIIRHRGCRV